MFITFTKRVLDGYGDIKLDVIKGECFMYEQMVFLFSI